MGTLYGDPILTTIMDMSIIITIMSWHMGQDRGCEHHHEHVDIITITMWISMPRRTP